MNLTLVISIAAVIVGTLCLILFILEAFPAKKRAKVALERSPNNPVISPLPFSEWELQGTFNPAAFQDDDGRVHLLYRAIGADGLSRIGYASSSDGINFDTRSMYPVYVPLPGYGMPSGTVPEPVYNHLAYTSGGGWGGSEDPRTVRIGDKVYMTYVAFEGWDSVRIALTSIPLRDVKRERWNWKRPALISPPHEVNKNWVLFPEKIHGKYAILHSISPDIMIEYVDSIDGLGSKTIQSRPPKGGRDKFWDNWVRGAGPPPLRTSLGWLLLYHAMDKADPGKYKLGAMILDADDPKKILYRAPQPILEPDMKYENDGKPGVVYASGAVIIGDKLTVYYGGGDKHVCIAQTSLPELLLWLQKNGSTS